MDELMVSGFLFIILVLSLLEFLIIRVMMSCKTLPTLWLNIFFKQWSLRLDYCKPFSKARKLELCIECIRVYHWNIYILRKVYTLWSEEKCGQIMRDTLASNWKGFNASIRDSGNGRHSNTCSNGGEKVLVELESFSSISPVHSSLWLWSCVWSPYIIRILCKYKSKTCKNVASNMFRLYSKFRSGLTYSLNFYFD